ncbi:hypothetical protein PRZ48_002502 [Zasmidium cellare]|uniref:Ketosynthase family 3 (KS3) domain-containing protein n=1 Tax=Zasmidium cellare TaxID=395010 RepID=A0ABR0F7E4_ZASCE|nr:hypothetical protein PRZ48_002502 [Zasmidium cellare]
MSIVSATNLILFPPTFVALANLGRAIADGDNIRAVIRGSALNQDGKTPTITSPSVDAQIALMRSCYRQAGLDPKDTTYVEAHMTGTQVGDPIEAEAISAVFARDRPPGDPVLVGSVKTIIGHTEATSGLAGVMKAVLVVEKGLIPPNANFERPNPAIDLDRLNVKVPTEVTEWPQGVPRRVSVNNFGFGGANAHVIIEAFDSNDVRMRPLEPATVTRGLQGLPDVNGFHGSHPLNGGSGGESEHDRDSPKVARTAFTSANRVGSHELTNGAATVNAELNGSANPISRIFVLSSKDSSVTDSMRSNLASWLECKRKAGEDIDLASLSYTLAERRSRLPSRCAVAADSVKSLVTALNENKKATITRDAPRIGFVFNGQGGQWHAMGRELFAYGEFAQAMQEADAILEGLGATWSLIDELHKDQENSRVQQPAYSQPLCTVLQLALVRLLKSWGIEPHAMVSHSSGEAAAAFCAGALTFSEALGVIYYRGLLTEKHQHASQRKGAMLAAGISSSTAQLYLESLGPGRAVVACINSPESVTISGDEDAVVEIEALLVRDGHFARRLKIDAAYHSHHMLAMAEEYMVLLTQIVKPKHGKMDKIYGCPVTGDLLHDKGDLGPAHWVQNLTQPVLFSSALENMWTY